MRLKACNCSLLLLLLLSVIQCQFSACYRTEVEITPAPPVEETTKKSGFFGGIKNFFRGSSDTTTATPPALEVTSARSAPANQQPHPAPNNPQTPAAGSAGKPPPLAIPHAPLMPLGPRPDTPPSSPLAGSPQQPPQWPQVGAPSSTARTTQQHSPNAHAPAHAPAFGSGGVGGAAQRPNAAQQPYPGFGPYQPPKAQPSGLDLSYGGSGGGGTSAYPGAAGRPGFGLAPLTSSTTTTTTPRSAAPQPSMDIDLRGSFGTSSTSTSRTPTPREDFPALPSPRRPSTGTKEDFPALPAPRSPSPSPASPLRPSSPSAWNSPLSTPATPIGQSSPTPAAPLRPGYSPVVSSSTTPATPAGGHGVAFVPQSPAAGGSTTTVRNGFQSTGNSLASDDEIRALTETLYQKEINSQLSLVTVNAQGKTRSIDSTDEAAQPLLQVDSKALESPIIAKMRLLFNNYETDTSTNEYVTPNERKEENDFVDAVMATSVMRQAMQFLQSKDLVSADPKTHRDLIKELWFTQYSRGGGRIGSSGFEHVFVNEVKSGTIIGLHNWVYFYEQEQAGHLDYKGYMQTLDMGNKGKVLKVRFTHNGLNKPVNTLFIGTSPELELALYTVCFKLRPDRTCPVSLGNSRFGVVTYSWRYRGKSLIGSAYPEI